MSGIAVITKRASTPSFSPSLRPGSFSRSRALSWLSKTTNMCKRLGSFCSNMMAERNRPEPGCSAA